MKLRKILSKILYFIVVAMACFFGIQVVGTLIVTPILAFYGSAYNFYIISGDASYFDIAANATKYWLLNLVMLCLSVLFVRLIKKKREENE